MAAEVRVVLNLIYVDDASAEIVAGDRSLAGRTRAAERWPARLLRERRSSGGAGGEYYAEAARLIVAPPPQFTAQPPASSPAAAPRAGADRRVSSAKLRTVDGQGGIVACQYPKRYRDGAPRFSTPMGPFRPASLAAARATARG